MIKLIALLGLLVSPPVQALTISRGALTAALVGSTALGGCALALHRQHGSKVYAHDLICMSFEPILISKKDTKETKAQVIEYNAVWEEFCAKAGSVRTVRPERK